MRPHERQDEPPHGASKDEEELPDVVPPRELTPAEKEAAVKAYLMTDAGRRAIQDAVDKESSALRIRRSDLARPEREARATDERERAHIRAEMERQEQEQAAAEAAAAEASRTAGMPRRNSRSSQPEPVRDNSDHYRQQREEIRRRNIVSSQRRVSRLDPIQFEDGPYDPFAGMLLDI